MFASLRRNPIAWLSAGLVVGLVAGYLVAGMIAPTPAHAVATHGQEKYITCTAPVDQDTEAYVFLDTVTGDLKAGVINPQTAKFTVFFQRNILNDFELAGVQNPQFLMVSGQVDLRRQGANAAPAASAIYITELVSGDVVAYGMPWNVGGGLGGPRGQAPFFPLDKLKVRQPAA